MSLLVSQCTEEKNKAASVSGEMDCTSQVEPCKRQLALIHEHNERLKRVTRDQVWFGEKFARIATELGENRDLYRKLYFDHLRLTETIKAERENYNREAKKCENKLQKCEERLNQGITGDGFCNEDDKEEIQYLQQEIKQLKRILVSTQGELRSCKADYTKPSNVATEKTFSTFAVDGSSDSATGKNSDAKPLRCEAERADLKVKLASAIRERDRNKRHLLLQHELGERLKASIKDRLPIVEMSTQIANDIGKERDTYWDVYYRQLRTTETIKAQRDTYNLGESQCKKKLTKLQKRLARQEKQETDDDQSGFCNSDDAEEIKFLRDELTQQRRLMATMNVELENYKHDYSNFKNTGKSIGTFSAHQSTSCSTDTDKKTWAAENDELKNKLAEASLKMSEYQTLLERHQQQLRLQHKHAERLKAYVSEQLPFVDAFARIATELGKEKNTFHELYYTQVRLTEVIKAEKNNYERAARKWESKFNKLAEHISKKEHSNVCQGDEETISRDEHEEEIKFLREEITFQKRLLTVMKAALNAYKSDFLTGSRVGKIESYSLKDKKSDTVATGTNTNAKSTATEPKKESDSKCSNEKISHLQSQNEELKAKLETLEDDKINCQETVSVLRKRAEAAEAMHASVSNSMKVLSDSYSQWNATLEECEKEKGTLAFRNAGIDMVLTHLEDELKTKQQQWESKSSELTKGNHNTNSVTIRFYDKLNHLPIRCSTYRLRKLDTWTKQKILTTFEGTNRMSNAKWLGVPEVSAGEAFDIR